MAGVHTILLRPEMLRARYLLRKQNRRVNEGTPRLAFQWLKEISNESQNGNNLPHILRSFEF